MSANKIRFLSFLVSLLILGCILLLLSLIALIWEIERLEKYVDVGFLLANSICFVLMFYNLFTCIRFFKEGHKQIAVTLLIVSVISGCANFLQIYHFFVN